MTRVFESRNRFTLDSSVAIVNDKEFFNIVTNERVPVLVDFFADWCEPCQYQSTVLESLNDKLDGKLRIVKVEIEKYPSLGIALNITGLPTMILFVNGDPVETLVGARDESVLSSDISHALRKMFDTAD